MNKVFYFGALLLMAVDITACSKQVEKSAVQDGLVGTWQWVRTDGGFASHIHETPVTTGRNIDLHITADGKYSIYVDGALTSNGTYALEKRRCIHDHTNKTFINFSSDPDFIVETLDSNQLEVSDEAHDGLRSAYTRKRLDQ